MSYAEVVREHGDQAQAQTDGLLKGVSENVNQPIYGTGNQDTFSAAGKETKSGKTDSEKKDSLARIQSIPVVQETLDRVLSIIKSNSFLAALYSRGEQLTNILYSRTQNLINPVLSTADVYATKGLDAVEARYPDLFKANTQDVLKTAHAPVDFAINSFTTRLEGAQASLVAVQDRLTATASSVADKVPRSQEDAQKAAQEYYSELIKLRDQTKDQVANAPEHIKPVYEPLLASLQTGVDDVHKILADKEVSVTERASKIANYSKANLPNVFNDTLSHLKSLVVSKKEDAKKASE